MLINFLLIILKQLLFHVTDKLSKENVFNNMTGTHVNFQLI